MYEYYICAHAPENLLDSRCSAIPGSFFLEDMDKSGYGSDRDEEDTCHKGRCKRCSSDTNLADIVNDLSLTNSCVFLLRHPSVVNFCRLRKKLDSDDKRWILDFLRRDGLDLLFECLGDLAKYTSNFSNLVLRIECVMCIKTVMNSVVGLQSLISTGYGPQFAGGRSLYLILSQYFPSICIKSRRLTCFFV